MQRSSDVEDANAIFSDKAATIGIAKAVRMTSTNHHCYMRPLRRKTVVENPGASTTTAERLEDTHSVNYMPMRLSDLPKAFGLRDTSDKDVFPHLFNTRENQMYVRALPDIRYFYPDQMKPEEREQFLAWHSKMTNKGYIFDFQREIVRYCRNDVVFRRACMEFRKIFLERGDVCPFEECTTIASTCIKVFRKNFLREGEIGVIPLKGYRNVDKQSQKALRWLDVHRTSIRRPSDIFYGYSMSTSFINQYPMDVHRMSKGHKTDVLWISSISIKDVLWMSYGYPCAVWAKTSDHSRGSRTRFSNHALLKLAPLNPRDAFYGGHTENIATLYEVKGTEKMRYVDVCSLYPYVLKTGAFPIGHPDIYIGGDCIGLIGAAPNFNFDNVEGYRVLPPRDLYHPVLPYRVNGKLIFGLCRSCCETFSTASCTRDSPFDREFEGTRVSCELRKAVEKGYIVTEVSEICKKRAASGWPNECQEDDDETKERYLREYEETEGIVLEKANIARNPGLCSVTKLCLNSFWEKFRQRANLPKTEVVKTYQHFVILLTSSEHEITGILPVNDEVMYVSWRLREEAVVASPITNVVIAAYTTAQASSGDPNEPHTSNFLSDMTDELKSYGSGNYIESFVS
ncbi:uncharacterized protein LOC118644437 [Monomorium pharaonis]|uniref:uncharacterized protein LOC118644437 n=1 Tax=Monomorium pharaonis TaxID=307658 RepID=UPI0017465375|nr:uncharacterized protein LOC118644437 [Monomorium pharaonis]